jgi:hypothetical protein
MNSSQQLDMWHSPGTGIVPQQMGIDMFLDARPIGCLMACLADHLAGDGHIRTPVVYRAGEQLSRAKGELELARRSSPKRRRFSKKARCARLLMKLY